MGPFGAWLNSTVYEEGIQFIFLLQPPGGFLHFLYFYNLYISCAPRKGTFYLFPAGPPKGGILFIPRLDLATDTLHIVAKKPLAKNPLAKRPAGAERRSAADDFTV